MTLRILPTKLITKLIYCIVRSNSWWQTIFKYQFIYIQCSGSLVKEAYINQSLRLPPQELRWPGCPYYATFYPVSKGKLITHLKCIAEFQPVHHPAGKELCLQDSFNGNMAMTPLTLTRKRELNSVRKDIHETLSETVAESFWGKRPMKFCVLKPKCNIKHILGEREEGETIF